MKYEHTASERVEKLLADVTVDEKAGQLTQYFFFDLPEGAADMDLPGEAGDPGAMTRGVEQALDDGTVGSLLFVTDPAVTNRLQRRAIEGSRHGIPLLFGFDVIHGLRTIFPVPIALAASWSPEVAERAQTIAAREARAVGIHWAFAPMVDIARDARWGRMIEGAGEDPFLGGAMAAAQVRGFQGESIGAEDRILAGPKHFAGYGAAVGGRDYDEVDLSDQDFWNTYVQPFRAAVDAGAANIMSAYMDLNGVPATGNRWLLTDVLRDALGFEGFVVSDANSAKDLATHHYAVDSADAAARAIEAGLDMEMAVSEPSFRTLAEAVRGGRIAESRLDDSVRRILAVKERLGLLDDPFVDEEAASTTLADPAHREASREVSERTAVLLKNDGDVLPLDLARTPRIAVVGPLASSRRDVIGPWVFDFDLSETVSVLEGIERYVAGAGAAGGGAGAASPAGAATVAFAPGVAEPKRLYPSMFNMFGDTSPSAPEGFDAEAAFDEAVRLATDSDVAIVVVGEQQDMIGENASRSDIALPGDQQRLLEAVVATGTQVVVVVMNGRPLDLRWAAEHAPAILDVWYPGTRGGEAVANLLFGRATPSGKLPFSWPRTVGQIPMHYSRTRSHDPEKQDRRYWNEQSTPLFPFGHGLSYATFAYGAVSVSADEIDRDGTVTVSVDVTNTSQVAGSEMAQLYIHQRFGTSSRPLRLLKGFRRVELPAGATETVSFEVGPDERRYWSAATHGDVLDASDFDVWVGGSSAAEAHAEFVVR